MVLAVVLFAGILVRFDLGPTGAALTAVVVATLVMTFGDFVEGRVIRAFNPEE